MFSFEMLRMVLPTGLAAGATGSQVAPTEGEVAPWEVSPGHIQIHLDGYILQDKFHQPQIYVYPAQEYAAMFPAAQSNLERLNNAIQGSSEMPYIVSLNAAQVFTSNVQVIDFQNGRGVRFVTEYSQGITSVNSHDTFYNFQGLTSDGKYYIVAILPITSTLLADSPAPEATIPTGGVSMPDFMDDNADWNGYYAAIVNLLNGAPAESFSPRIEQLDALIASIQVQP
jgi:hypothetical protein